ncbi:hypothetical protein DUI87_24974 [Hirundo rustica rustica]|uniref:Uncharacterized protein n=1 Tax=Hirundo rustica rustica TaxID=333673 RepID=A0A3M0JCQ5_HIRRU|nr:hypothetical protein DUI87_24974 [Hirundo rustica rustica]
MSDQQSEEGDSAPLLCSGVTPLGMLHPALGSSAQEGLESVRAILVEATKMILRDRETLVELGLFSLEKSRLQDILNPFQLTEVSLDISGYRFIFTKVTYSNKFIAMRGSTNLFRSSWHCSQAIRELSEE